MRLVRIVMLLNIIPVLAWAQNEAVQEPSRVVLYVVITSLIVLVAYIAFRELSFKITRESQNRRILELEQHANKLTEEKNILIGENKQLVPKAADAEARFQSIHEQLSKAQQKIVILESERHEYAREQARNIRELENSRKALEDEQARVRKEEEERRKREEEERDRIWAVHEQEAIATMKDVCQKPAVGFPSYDANNLPPGFDSSLRPDFMVEFLGLYMIFDPKISKSNLASYIKSQVKASASKYKQSSSADQLYKTAFFVIPTTELRNLKEYSYFEQGFTFYVIPLEAFEPIINAYRRIADYDLAEKFDPQERENIVNLIALLSQQIRHQNATNVLSTILGVKALQECGNLPLDVSESVEERLKTMRVPSFKPSDVKRLLNSPEEQMRELARLATPSKAPISLDDLNKANESSLGE